MSYLEELEKSVTGLGMKFMHADIYEANMGVDSVESVDFPLFVLIAPRRTANKIDGSGMIHRRVPIFAFILYRYEGQDTPEAEKSLVVQYVQAATRQADRLIHLLNGNTVTDQQAPENGIVDFSTDETYAKFDGNLYGVKLEFTWPVNERTRGC